MTLASSTSLFAQAVGADIKAIWSMLNGKAADLTALTTSVKTNLVAAINSLKTEVNAKAPIASPTFTGTVGGITKSMVGLGTVDNTSDAAKPVSTATQAALDLKLNTSQTTAFTRTLLDDVDAAAARATLGLAAAAIINDALTNTTNAWSGSKIQTEIQAAISGLVDGADGALDTLNEIATALQNNPNVISTILTAQGKRVAVDQSQTFTPTEQLQGCENLGVGNPTIDMVLAYTSVRDAA